MQFPIFHNFSRYLASLILMFTGAGFIVGCSDDDTIFIDDAEPTSGFITFTLNCVEADTRAPEDYTEAGKKTLNENNISSVILCLWKDDGFKPDETAVPDYVQTFTNLDNEMTVNLRVPLTEVLKKALFETSEKCNAFVAVNVTPPTGSFTIAELRNMAIGSTFNTQRVQSSFAMDGDCQVEYYPALNTAHGDIPLQRSASKITLALNVDEIVEQTVVIDGKPVTSHWKPDTQNMQVQLIGGLKSTTLDPDLTATPAEDEFFNTPQNLNYTFVNNTFGEAGTPDNGNNPGDRTYPYIQNYPFYSYPHRWSADPNDYASTYMQLTIPWKRVNADGSDLEEGSSWRTCYYQVPAIAADSDILQLVRNVSYHVYLHVGLLGSFVPDEPLPLEDMAYSAAEWGTVNMDVNIPEVRYLVVDQNDYTVNNETSITIPFYTSHETIVTDATMTFYRYNFDDVGQKLPVTVTMVKNEESAKANRGGEPVFTASFDNNAKELTVTHDLVMYEGFTSSNAKVSFTQNDSPSVGKREPQSKVEWDNLMNTISYFKKQPETASVPDVNEFSVVEFRITVQHKDIHSTQPGSHNFEEVITITQYPGMYISSVSNYCETNVSSFEYTGAQGNAFINTFTRELNGTDRTPSQGLPLGWTTSIGLNTDYFNFNPNMYLVTVTTLPQDTKYKIGDPRSNNINNNLESTNRNENIVSLLGRSTTASNFYGNSYDLSVQQVYTKALITRGINNKLADGENKTPWSGTTYSWYYWRRGTVTSMTTPYYINQNQSGSVNCTGFSNARGIYPSSASRNISYYYPTREEDDYKNMIAPKFRICSSYAGTTWILNRELARRRAAAYQEMGYAAGRWRLPTFGEVEFIMELAAQFKIPRLFGTFTSTWWYWCAQGLVCVPSKDSGKPGVTLPDDTGFELPIAYISNGYDGARDCHRARFVYDEWYWGEADLKASGEIGSASPVYTFTWGDRPM